MPTFVEFHVPLFVISDKRAAEPSITPSPVVKLPVFSIFTPAKAIAPVTVIVPEFVNFVSSPRSTSVMAK